jgi:hypothetical protein
MIKALMQNDLEPVFAISAHLTPLARPAKRLKIPAN